MSCRYNSTFHVYFSPLPTLYVLTLLMRLSTLSHAYNARSRECVLSNLRRYSRHPHPEGSTGHGKIQEKSSRLLGACQTPVALRGKSTYHLNVFCPALLYPVSFCTVSHPYLARNKCPSFLAHACGSCPSIVCTIVDAPNSVDARFHPSPPV